MSHVRKAGRWPRVGWRARVGCGAGAIGALAFLAAARWFFPFGWTDPRARVLFGQPCLLRESTGIPCPFCGATRSTVAAAHGRFVEAFRFHIVGVPMVMAAGLLALWLLICAATGRDLGLSAMGRVLATPWLLWGVLIMTGVFWAYKLVTDWALGWLE